MEFDVSLFEKWKKSGATVDVPPVRLTNLVDTIRFLDFIKDVEFDNTWYVEFIRGACVLGNMIYAERKNRCEFSNAAYHFASDYHQDTRGFQISMYLIVEER